MVHIYFVVCLVGVWQRNFEPVVCGVCVCVFLCKVRRAGRINTGSLYRNVSILNYKRDKDNVS